MVFIFFMFEIDHPATGEDKQKRIQKAGERAKKQAALAGAANEKMLAGYSYE